MMRKLIFLAVAAVLFTAACASEQKPKTWDKEGVRHRAGETGQKLDNEKGY